MGRAALDPNHRGPAEQARAVNAPLPWLPLTGLLLSGLVLVAGCADSGGALPGSCGSQACPVGTTCGASGRCEPSGGGDPPVIDPEPVAPDGGTVPIITTTDDGGPAACGATTFRVTDTQESLMVPADVSYMHVKVWGAGGNGEGACDGMDDGGLGGYSEALFQVTPGMPLIVIVGRRGRAGISGEDRNRFGFGAHGGGGLSGIFHGGASITPEDAYRAMIIAGGGGSAAARTCAPGGTGNHTTAGGMPNMLGEFGHDREGILGGGGGHRGGSGGDLDNPAHGGTGFIAEDALEKRMLNAPPGSGAPPNTEDADYDGTAGKTEQSGHVVIHYLCERPPGGVF